MNRERAIRGLAIFAMVAVFAAGNAQAGGLIGAAGAVLAKRAAQSSVARVGAAKAALRPVGKPHDVIISRSRHPQAAAHVDHAQGHGQPSVLHIDRAGAQRRRAASIGSIDRARKPGPHYDRDEYPPAFTTAGGHNASVRFIDRHSNRGAGSSMRAQTRTLPDGAKIRIVVGP